jgi:hypothetical protein
MERCTIDIGELLRQAVEAALRGDQVACVAPVCHQAEDVRGTHTQRGLTQLTLQTFSTEVAVHGGDVVAKPPLFDVRSHSDDPACGLMTRRHWRLQEGEPARAVDEVPETDATGPNLDEDLVCLRLAPGGR